MDFINKFFFGFIFLVLMFGLPILYEFWKFKKETKENRTKIKFWKSFFEMFGLTKFTWKTLLWGFLLSLALIAINILFVSLSSLFSFNDLSNSTVNQIKNFAAMPIFFSIFLLLSAIAEEFFFRSFLTTYLGVWISTIFFAIMHFTYGSYFEIVGAFILGLVLALVWKKKKNFYIIAVAHFLQNLYAILFMILY